MIRTQPLMDVRAALKAAMARLRAAHVPSHWLAAELLMMHTLGRDRAWLYAHPEAEVPPADSEKYNHLVEQRCAGAPTQYLTGKQEFWGLEFEVTREVLIPRPETEHVVEVALERMGKNSKELPLAIADVGTGSGCLAVALAREFPRATVLATDVSAAALEVASRNAARHGVAARIEFAHCNLLDGFAASSLAARRASLELVVSNPPYVARAEGTTLPREVGDHEPPNALFGGEDGVDVYPPLAEQAANVLRPGGLLVVELGYNSEAHVRPLFDSGERWRNVTTTLDLAGIPRVLAAERR